MLRSQPSGEASEDQCWNFYYSTCSELAWNKGITSEVKVCRNYSVSSKLKLNAERY